MYWKWRWRAVKKLTGQVGLGTVSKIYAVTGGWDLDPFKFRVSQELARRKEPEGISAKMSLGLIHETDEGNRATRLLIKRNVSPILTPDTRFSDARYV